MSWESVHIQAHLNGREKLLIVEGIQLGSAAVSNFECFIVGNSRPPTIAMPMPVSSAQRAGESLKPLFNNIHNAPRPFMSGWENIFFF
jgi:hypothetical protein